MRIAHIANFYGPTSGGLRTAMHALGAGYQERGHEVMLVVPGPADRVEDTPFGKRVSVKAPLLPLSGGYRVITKVGQVRGILQAFNPDVLEVSDRTTLRGVGGWAQQRGIPSVFFAHERADGVLNANLPAWARRGSILEDMADFHNRGTSERFTTIVCTTSYAAAEFERAGLPTVTIPLGVDLETFHPSRHSPELRGRLASPDEVLLFLGSRLSTEKRPDLAIEAVRTLADRGVKVRLVSAGTGAIEGQIRERAEGLPVTFLGFVAERDRFASLLATADVVIAPGPIETFGLAALEALASGTPVVVNASSALPEVVGEAGVAAQGSGEDFAEAVQQILEIEPPVRRERARRRAETMPWSRTIDEMLALHEKNLADVRGA